MSKTKGSSPIQGTLTDISVVNTGSGSVSIPANPDRNIILFNNPNLTTVGVNLSGATASVGTAGTVSLGAGLTLSFQNGYVPTNAIQVCSTSGSGVTIVQG